MRIYALIFGLLLSCVAVAAPDVDPFKPQTAGTVTISATTTSAATALVSSGRTQVLVYNAGSSTVFLEFGTSAVAAVVASGLPVPSGAILVLSVDPTVTHVAAITGSGTATVYVTVGRGI